MAARSAQPRSITWKWTLLGLCALSFCAVIASIVGVTGFGGRPWYGWRDGFVIPAQQPYVLRFSQLDIHGAAYKAGLGDGDTADLRNQSPSAQVQAIFQPSAIAPIRLRVTRGSTTRDVRFLGGTLWIAWLFYVARAALIAANRWLSRNATLLVLIFLAYQLALALGPGNFVPPNYGAEMFCFAFSGTAYAASFALFVPLTSSFGRKTAARRVIEGIAYAATPGVVRMPPSRYCRLIHPGLRPVAIYLNGALWTLLADIAVLLVLVAAAVAVGSTPTSERPRAAWLLLPLPVASAITNLLGQVISSGPLVLTASAGIYILGAVAVTYALLKLRVLDFEFVLSRRASCLRVVF